MLRQPFVFKLRVVLEGENLDNLDLKCLEVESKTS
jgi:hypothetical protein